MQFILIQCIFLCVAYGLEFEPQPDLSSTLITYRSSVETTSYRYRHRLDSFLAPYSKTLSDTRYFVECIIGIAPEKGSNQVCNFDVTRYTPCRSSNNYNYNTDEGGPCVFLKLRKESNWVPEYYNTATIPNNMPPHLKERILTIEQMYGPDSNELKIVWVSCDGEYPIDKENIGPLQYYPLMGFGGQYFPIRNEERYLSPLVAIHFEHVERAIIINVQCKAWAKNLIDEDVSFELMVDY